MFDLDAKPNYLLTYQNPKIVKGEKNGVFTAVMHFAPYTLSGANVCPHATAGCAAACLNTAGRGGIGLDDNGLNAIQVARIQHTRFFRRDKASFLKMLKHEIDLHIRRAKKHGMTPAIRLNGTSDLPWENVKFFDHANVFDAYPNVQFYDYTKIPVNKRNLHISNYHLTFSLAESNRSEAIKAIREGINVAAVIRCGRNKPLPATLSFGGSFRKVIDGDKTDVRFADAKGCIIGLRAKGKARFDTTGFVLDV